MINRKNILAGAVLASLAAFSQASIAKDIYISIDPPARPVERYENRPGQTFVPGVWEYRQNKYHWVAGHYVADRKGYRWERDRWVRHNNDKWTMQRGGWARDSDGDGTPDRNDSQPNNPRKQ